VIVHELSTYVTLGRDTSDIARVLERTDFQSSLSPEQQRTEVLQVLLKARARNRSRHNTGQHSAPDRYTGDMQAMKRCCHIHIHSKLWTAPGIFELVRFFFFGITQKYEARK
jgi:hypothetical protein